MGAMQRLLAAASGRARRGLLVFALTQPAPARSPAGEVGVGAWLIAGAADRDRRARLRLFARRGERLAGGCRACRAGAWGMSLAHLGLGVFVLGAAFETTWRIEAAEVLSPGEQHEPRRLSADASGSATAPGPNYDAERADPWVADASRRGVHGGAGAAHLSTPAVRRPRRWRSALEGPRRRLHRPGRAADRRRGRSAWLVRAFWNRWVRLIFLGPL